MTACPWSGDTRCVEAVVYNEELSEAVEAMKFPAC